MTDHERAHARAADVMQRRFWRLMHGGSFCIDEINLLTEEDWKAISEALRGLSREMIIMPKEGS